MTRQMPLKAGQMHFVQVGSRKQMSRHAPHGISQGKAFDKIDEVFHPSRHAREQLDT